MVTGTESILGQIFEFLFCLVGAGLVMWYFVWDSKRKIRRRMIEDLGFQGYLEFKKTHPGTP